MAGSRISGSPLLTVLLAVFTVKQIAGQNTKFSCSVEQPSLYVCQNGIWPVKFSFPTSDQHGFTPTRLLVKQVTLRTNVFEPYPRTDGLVSLSFRAIRTWDAGQRLARFPLQNFTRSLDRACITQLELHGVFLGSVSENDFVGFTGLESLHLSGCNITTFHPRGFYPLATLEGEDLNAKYMSRMKQLSISRDSQLATFPWDALYPLTDSLKSISFARMDKLSNVTFELPEATTPMTFKSLHELTFTWTQMSTLPTTVINSFSHFAKSDNSNSRQHMLKIEFTHNDNMCKSCDLIPLMDFAHSDTSKFIATCITGYKVNTRMVQFQDMPDTKNYWQDLPGSRNYRTAYQVPDECQETTTPTFPSSTTTPALAEDFDVTNTGMPCQSNELSFDEFTTSATPEADLLEHEENIAGRLPGWTLPQLNHTEENNTSLPLVLQATSDAPSALSTTETTRLIFGLCFTIFLIFTCI